MELCFNNTFGTVCDVKWDVLDARVACGRLGFNASGKFVHVSKFITNKYAATSAQYQHIIQYNE